MQKAKGKRQKEKICFLLLPFAFLLLPCVLCVFVVNISARLSNRPRSENGMNKIFRSSNCSRVSNYQRIEALSGIKFTKSETR